MIYIDPDGNYPRFAGDIIIANPAWNFGDPAPEGWVEVQPTDYPELTETEIAYEGVPELVEGAYVQVWDVRELTAEELARKNAPILAKQKLLDAGLTEEEITALVLGLR